MKNIVLICSCIVMVHQLKAQGYLRAGVGAGFNVTNGAFAIPALTVDSNNVVVAQRAIFGAFGQRVRFSLVGGYMITPYFGVELGVYYFQGFKQAYGSQVGLVVDQYERKGYSYQLRATPSLVL